MKKLGLITLMLAQSTAFAVNPAQGWYGGVILGFSYSPDTSYNYPLSKTVPSSVPITLPSTVPIKIINSELGLVGIQGGYRCGKLRGEGEFIYNNTPISGLKIQNTTLKNNKSQYYNFQAGTNTVALMANVFYDFLPSNPESSIAPYVGFGAGIADVSTIVKFGFYDTAGVNVKNIRISQSTSSAAGQGIIGVSLFADDYTAFSADFRYFATATKSKYLDARTQLYTFNILFNGMFDAGA